MGPMMTSQHLSRSLSLSASARKIKKLKNNDSEIAEARGKVRGKLLLLLVDLALKEKENRDLMAATVPGIEGRQDEEVVCPAVLPSSPCQYSEQLVLSVLLYSSARQV
ncbi:Uncharacterized protein Fot_21473 [Forsythia ovata]|uniref:Uncharacterized protein n=1 Tax=Forsythia ovata TaxID=205694 RepID=A0ABD1UV28_9LAMI